MVIVSLGALVVVLVAGGGLTGIAGWLRRHQMEGDLDELQGGAEDKRRPSHVEARPDTRDVQSASRAPTDPAPPS